ncbi:MAG: 16S rRNA (guanine(966)-N(2))-methyltransferase RsmD [Oscillospiraceae bacterium]|nr:16S rRNA (guanine(966)-N(2))-methyltransferase RsmD [Oscillospiraceae bacterium]
MRVITGAVKGVSLHALTGESTRPTSDKVKEAMFSAIQFDVEGAIVLDLFAGSGQLGIEALSRGAKKAYFADNNPKAVALINENLKKTGFDPTLSDSPSRVDKLPYAAFLRLVKDEFDIVFLDPPYKRGIIGKVFPLLLPKMKHDTSGEKKGIIICEHESELLLPDEVYGYKAAKTYRYGSVGLTIYTA